MRKTTLPFYVYDLAWDLVPFGLTRKGYWSLYWWKGLIRVNSHFSTGANPGYKLSSMQYPRRMPIIGEPRPLVWCRARYSCDDHLVLLPGFCTLVSVTWRMLRKLRKSWRRFTRRRVLARERYLHA